MNICKTCFKLIEDWYEIICKKYRKMKETTCVLDVEHEYDQKSKFHYIFKRKKKIYCDKIIKNNDFDIKRNIRST